MAYTLVCTLASSILPYLVVKTYNQNELYAFLKRLVLFTATIGFIYALQSFLDLGLRTEAGKLVGEFGIERVRGPLFGSSTGHLILIPAFGFSINELIVSFSKKSNRLFWSMISLSLLFVILALGSRAAVICLAAFVIIMIPLLRGLGKKILTFAVVAFMLCIALALLNLQANTDRLSNMEDMTRLTTHRTAWDIVTSSSIPQLLIGHGYGSYWPWYLADIEDGGARATGRFMNKTSFGPILYHPHSVLLLLVVELGILGLCFYIYSIWFLLKMVIYVKAYAKFIPFICGTASASLAFFFDLFLFKSWELSSIWWLFLFSSINIVLFPANKGTRKISK